MNSELFNKARENANKAFDEHCIQWDLLQKIPAPNMHDLEKWLLARNELIAAQEKFESITGQIYG